MKTHRLQYDEWPVSKVPELLQVLLVSMQLDDKYGSPNNTEVEAFARAFNAELDAGLGAFADDLERMVSSPVRAARDIFQTAPMTPMDSHETSSFAPLWVARTRGALFCRFRGESVTCPARGQSGNYASLETCSALPPCPCKSITCRTRVAGAFPHHRFLPERCHQHLDGAEVHGWAQRR